jgi:hypothetical protein
MCTWRYLGCEQHFRDAVNDHASLEPMRTHDQRCGGILPTGRPTTSYHPGREGSWRGREFPTAL